MESKIAPCCWTTSVRVLVKTFVLCTEYAQVSMSSELITHDYPVEKDVFSGFCKKQKDFKWCLVYNFD